MKWLINVRRTEYEFSPSSDEPVAKMFGEYIFEYMVFAWHVSTMKSSSLYLRQENERGYRDKEEIDMPLLLPHLLECICNIEGADFFIILKLQELIPTMSSYVDENIWSGISQ